MSDKKKLTDDALKKVTGGKDEIQEMTMYQCTCNTTYASAYSPDLCPCPNCGAKSKPTPTNPNFVVGL
ncbi:MAG: hypothetical protein K5696_01110 [Lachnospiraceae bacterium]|nr:hypothetical protein [Lachnospiraceae bacterium]